MVILPKKYVQGLRLSLYKRFTQLQKAVGFDSVYVTTADSKRWRLDIDKLEFIEITPKEWQALLAAGLNPNRAEDMNVVGSSVYRAESGYYAYYDGDWQISNAPPDGYTLLSARFNNFAKVQANAYYWRGDYDFAYSGNTAGSETQPLRGLITPLTSFNIRVDGEIDLDHGDYTVIDGRLYSVENVERQMIQQPRIRHITFATCNGIL
jgi:hypothetical protein